MRIGELAKMMFRAFFIITTGTVVSMYVFCLIFYPDAHFSPGDIGGILLAAFFSDLTFLVFCSRKELRKKQMLIRFAIHIPILLAVLFYFAYLWNWLDINNPKEVSVLVLLIFCVYAVVFAIIGYQDKRTAEKLNEGLRKRYPS